MSDPTPTDAEMTTDVPALLARADLVHLGRQVALVGDGDGFTTEVCGVKIAKCDARGRTEADIRAEKAEAEVERLARWKAEALSALAGLQELGKALGLPLGEQITGPKAAEEAAALLARAEKAEAELAAAREALARVEALVEEYEQSDGTISHRLAGRRFRAALALTDTEMCVACDQPVDRVLPKPIPEGYDCMWSEAMCGLALYCQACFDDADPPTTTRPAAKERP